MANEYVRRGIFFKGFHKLIYIRYGGEGFIIKMQLKKKINRIRFKGIEIILNVYLLASRHQKEFDIFNYAAGNDNKEKKFLGVRKYEYLYV